MAKRSGASRAQGTLELRRKKPLWLESGGLNASQEELHRGKSGTASGIRYQTGHLMSCVFKGHFNLAKKLLRISSVGPGSPPRTDRDAAPISWLPPCPACRMWSRDHRQPYHNSRDIINATLIIHGPYYKIFMSRSMHDPSNLPAFQQIKIKKFKFSEC